MGMDSLLFSLKKLGENVAIWFEYVFLHFISLFQEASRSTMTPFGIETIINKMALTIPMINTTIDPDAKTRVNISTASPEMTVTKRIVRVTSAVATAATVTIIAPKPKPNP